MASAGSTAACSLLDFFMRTAETGFRETLDCFIASRAKIAIAVSCLATLGCTGSRESSGLDRRPSPGPVELTAELVADDATAREPKPASLVASATNVSAAIATTRSVTVASYNINAGMTGNASTRQAIGELDADIIALQEVTEGWKRAIEDLFAKSHRYRRYTIDPREHYGGLAILSKFPIVRDEILAAEAGPFAAWRGELDTPIGTLQVVNVHLFPPVRWFRSRGVARAYQDGQRIHKKELIEHSAAVEKTLPTLIVGDFNENRDGVGIQWLLGRGFSTAHKGYEPTWRWKLRNGFEVTFQLDHILLRGLNARDAKVHSGGRSDHRPISATVFLPASSATENTTAAEPQ